jgi:N-acetylmuramoyl-L-alanine amidase
MNHFIFADQFLSAMKHLATTGILILLLLLSSFTTLNNNKYYVTTVVIDAGHGGKDPGAVSGGVREKDIALNIALLLGGYIEQYLEGVEVIYTRTDDIFVELWERSEIANKNNADVFISIHCNSSSHSYVHGTETYCMGLHRSEDNLQVAMRENKVIQMEEDHEERYDGFDPTSPEDYIMFSLHQNVHLERSLKLASLIEEQFANRVGRHSRGVKQAGFLVLYRSSMPAVLVESGFLTNRNDRNFLSSEQGQIYIASAIYRAFRDYKEELES